ncbi:nucleoside phosphorylase [Candidatus Bathyarchaeota archaeon]|nr:nucleoside phosphorylase [Candidatus Bathyarchaeota archaeon]
MIGFIRTVKPDEEPIVKPTRFSDTVKRYGLRAAIITFTSEAFTLVKDALDRYEGLERVPLGCLRAVMSGKVGVFQSYFGSAASAMLMEILVAGGVKYFMVMGAAGSIKREVKAGDVVVPTWGLREEGVSYHYVEPDVMVKPDPSALRTLEDSLAEAGLDFKTGGIWSTDAPFMETLSKVREYSDMGVLVVDMEMTALMAVGMRRGVKLAGVVTVTDELYSGDWKLMFDSDVVASSEKRVAYTVVKASRELSSKNV